MNNNKKKLSFAQHEELISIFYDCSTESPNGRILTEEQYRWLQTLGNFDTKTSSWIITPNEIRKLGALSFVITVTIRSSCITMVRMHIMLPGVFVVH